MLKVSANQMDYAAATSLYSRSLGLLKTAIGSAPAHDTVFMPCEVFH
jgi:hypothetical protein